MDYSDQGKYLLYFALVIGILFLVKGVKKSLLYTHEIHLIDDKNKLILQKRKESMNEYHNQMYRLNVAHLQSVMQILASNNMLNQSLDQGREDQVEAAFAQIRSAMQAAEKSKQDRDMPQ